MKIKKLLCIKLVGKDYIVVEDAGRNRTIPVHSPHNFKTNDLYEITEEPVLYEETKVEDAIVETKVEDAIVEELVLKIPVESTEKDLVNTESEWTS